MLRWILYYLGVGFGFYLFFVGSERSGNALRSDKSDYVPPFWMFALLEIVMFFVVTVFWLPITVSTLWSYRKG